MASEYGVETVTLADEFGWKVAEYGGTDLRVHGVLFVLVIVALFFAGNGGGK